MFAQSILQSNCDVERTASGNSASNTRHGDHGNVFHLDVSCGLGNEHQTLIQEVQKTLIGLDRTLDTLVAMVAEMRLAFNVAG